LPKQIPGLSSIKSDVSVNSVARYFGGNKYIADQKTSDRIHRAIDEASSLISPEGSYTLCSVSEMTPGEEMILENGSRLSLPECFVDHGTRLVAATIGTLGYKLEKQCRLLADGGQIYESTLLDSVGTAMLDLLGERISNAIEQDGKRIGLARGVRFAPGLEGYPLGQQRLLFQIADNESVDVFLNSSAVMIPTKSISFFLMLTATVLKNEETDKCNSCRLVGCQYRIVKKRNNLP
jgi:hypothetical protein